MQRLLRQTRTLSLSETAVTVPPQPRQNPGILIPSASDIRQKHTPVNCWQSARAVSRAADRSTQTLPAGSFSSHTKLCARETEIPGQLQSSVPGRLKSRGGYTASWAQKDIILSRFPCIPRNLQAPIHISLEFLECVRCSVHKWSRWVQCWQNDCIVSIYPANLVHV